MKFRLRPRFSVRMLLVMVAIFAMPLGYLSSQKRWAMARQEFRLAHQDMEIMWAEFPYYEPPGLLSLMDNRMSADAWNTAMGEEALAEALRLFPEAEPFSSWQYDEEKVCANPECGRTLRIPNDSDEAGKRRVHCNLCIQSGLSPE